MSIESMSMSPAAIAKLSPNDAKRLSQYILAIEKENKSRNEERVFMENYINDLKNQLQQLQMGDRGRRNKENQLNSQINRLAYQNRRLTADLGEKQNVISNLLKQIENLNRGNFSTEQKINKLETQYKEKIAQIIQQNKLFVLQVQNRKDQQIGKLNKNSNELVKKSEKYQSMYNQSMLNLTKVTTLNQRLEQQLNQLKQRVKLYEKQMSSKTRVDALQFIKAKQQIERLHQKLGLVAMQNQRLNYQNQQYKNDKMILQNQLNQRNKNYEKQKRQWNQKQFKLQQFLSFIRSNIKDMQNTIEQQNKQIRVLKSTNQKFRDDILNGLQKMSIQDEKQKQLNKIKIQLASCKGKLAQKQRQLSTSGSRIWATPADDYFPPKTRIKTQEMEDDKKSMRSGTFSTRDKIKKIGQNYRNSKTIGSENIIIPN